MSRVLIAGFVAFMVSWPNFCLADSTRVLVPSSFAHQVDEARSKRETQREVAAIGGRSWAPPESVSPIDVTSYALSLNVDIDREVISGRVTIDFVAVTDGLSEVTLDCDAGLRVFSVDRVGAGNLADGPRILEFNHQDDRLRIVLPAALDSGQSSRIEVAYSGRGTAGTLGVQWDTRGSGRPVVATFAEPFGARLWFPGNDRPDDKAIVSLEVRAPADLIATSNGLEVDVRDLGDGTKLTRWQSVYPISTYLIVMNIADFVRIDDVYDAQDGSQMPVVTYCYPELLSAAESDFERMPEMIQTLASLFGEYPFVEEKYGNCTTPFAAASAMEHQTLTTIKASLVTGQGNIDNLNVHELGHQWWGDMVGPADWKDIWLNEGFATYSEVLWNESRMSQGAFQQYIEDLDWAGFMVGPVYDNPVAFSGTIYRKGAWVLRLLRSLLGDDGFFEVLARYRTAHEGGGATTAEFQQIAESVHGEPLGWFFDQWVYGENRPRLLWSQEATDDGLTLTIDQVQGNGPIFRFPLDVRVQTDTSVLVTRVEVLGDPATFELEVAGNVLSVELDPDHLLLAHLGEAQDPDLELGGGWPQTHRAGVVPVGASGLISVPVHNRGGSDLTLTSVAPWQRPDTFTVISPTFPATIRPGEETEILLSFHPQAVGSRSDWLFVQSDDPSDAGLTLARINGVGASGDQPDLRHPAQVTFADTPVLGATEARFRLVNDGSKALDLVLEEIADPAFRVLAWPAHLEPSESADVLARFTPPAAGSHAFELGFASAAGRQVIGLSGVGVAAPRLEIEPRVLDLGFEPALDLTLRNVGGATLTVAGLEIDGGFLVDGDVESIGPGGVAALTVRQPSEAGPWDGLLTILTDDPGWPVATVPLHAHVSVGQQTTSRLPIATRASGIGGSDWRTDLGFLNPTLEDQVVVLSLDGAAADRQMTVDVPAGHQRYIDDVLSQVGLQGLAVITGTQTGGFVVQTSRTSTRGDGGSYGQWIPWDSLLAPASPVQHLVGLRSNGFRSNLGATNLGDRAIDIQWEIFSADGDLLGTESRSLAPGAAVQVVRALAGTPGGPHEGAWARVTSPTSGASFSAWASVVDDVSNDPTWIPGHAELVTDAVLLSAAKSPGANGTVWISDVELVNPADQPAVATLEYHPTSGEVRALSWSLPARSAVHLEDIVAIFGTVGSGWVRVLSDLGVIASGRTYNRGDGTYGQGIPAISVTDLADSSSTRILPALIEDDRFRTNLGLINEGPTPSTFDIEILSASGQSLWTQSVTVAARGLVQFFRILDGNNGSTRAGWARITTRTPDARWEAYASIVDEVTGDPSLVPSAREPD